MRRKLIKQEAFDQITNSSVTNAEHELKEAEDILARALGKDHLSLRSFNEATVLYETLDGSYVHAGYEIKNDQITFNGIEELVVDHDSKKAKQKAVLAEMIDSVLVDNTEKAGDLFNQYMSMYSFNEAKKTIVQSVGQNDFEARQVEEGHKAKGKLPKKLPPWMKKDAAKKAEEANKFKKTAKGKQHEEAKDAFKKRLKSAGKLKEAYEIAENVLDYVKYLQIGPVLAESVAKTDENGNVLDLRIPASKLRNENRIQRFNWKTLNEKVKVLRNEALSLAGDQTFVKAMSDLRRQNRLSDSQGLSEVLENVVGAWPHVIYATQIELAKVIGESLQVAGINNFGDQDCEFMAEGVLRTAFDAYQERVNQILHLAGATQCEAGQDAYEHFQAVVEPFYASIDEKFELERKVYEDLYESLSGIYGLADRRGDEQTKHVTASYLNDLADILNEKAKPDVELVEEVAHWVVDFIETNLGGDSWSPSNKVHVTVSGDHPDMAKKASKGYTPSKDFSPDWGDELPMIGQDSMNYKGGKHSKQARSSSWGNEAGKDTFPSLKNPYVPKPFGDYTMKGEKGVDKDTFGQHHSTWNSGDTWPKLQNPYVPKAETAKTYKMNKGKEKDLIVDK